jgi:hypothetical protein
MSDINFGYVTPDTCPFEIMTEEQIRLQAVPKAIPNPPKEPPPVGKNYVYEGDKWVLKDNPVFNVNI